MLYSIENKMYKGIKMLQQIIITLILRWCYFLQHIVFAKRYLEVGGEFVSKEEFRANQFLIVIFPPLRIYVSATLFSELWC